MIRLLVGVLCLAYPLQAQPSLQTQFHGGWVYSADSGAITGAFVTIKNPSPEPDTIVAVRADCAEHVEMHTTIRNSDGTMGMRPIAELIIPARKTVVLKPRSLHLMLYRMRRTLRKGDRCIVFFRSKRHGELSAEFEVRR